MFQTPFDYMNRDDAFRINLDDIARQIISMNYGTTRILAAIVRARESSFKSPDKLSEEIRALVERMELDTLR
jgi:hypothetical protein